MLPSLVLKIMVMGTFDKGYVDSRTADSIDFMVVSVSGYMIYESILLDNFDF